MKVRTRKLWTVLIAAVFVIAVALGVFFMLDGSRRGSENAVTAEAVDGDFTISSEQGVKVLYSYEKLTGSTVGETFIYSATSNQDGFISGTVNNNNLWTYQDDVVLLVYSDADCTNRVYDLRPRATETGSTFTRYFRVQVVVDGQTRTSSSIGLTITAAQPNTNPLNVYGNTVFPALTAFEESVGNLTVQVIYKVDSSNPYEAVNKAITLDYTGKDEEGNPIYGGYWIEYQDDADVEDRTDVFEFDDDYIDICYREAGWEEAIKVRYDIDVTEAYVDAPIPDDTAGAFTNATYHGQDQDFEFDYYSATSSTATVHSYQPFVSGWTGSLTQKNVDSAESAITYSASEAGTYGVTFHANTGYQYRSIPSAAVSVIIRETVSGSTKEVTYEGEELEELKASEAELPGALLSVTYEWKIDQATITGATIGEANQLPESWQYGTEPEEPTAGEIALTTNTSIENLTADSETVFAAGTSHTNFIYKGTNSTSYSSTALPSDAGNYTWAVQLTGMNNFKDFTGSATAFEIYKQVVDLPALDQTSFEYDGSSHAPQLTGVPANPPYGTLSVTPQTAAGSYEATLTLTDSDNYEWADPEEDSGITVSGATATYSWSIGKAVNTITDLQIAGWTWGKYDGTDNAPSASVKFDGDITYTYHKTQDGDEISADTLKYLNAGTYWVKAVSTATDNYDADTEWLQFEVEKAALARPTLKESELTYNGKAQTPVLGDAYLSDLANEYYTFAVTEQTLVNASGETYEAKVTLDENHCWANNSGTEPITLTWTITPAEITTEGALSRDGWTYGDTESALTNTLESTVNFATEDDGTAEMTVVYYQKNGNDFEAIDGEPTNAGTYYVAVTFTYAENANGVSNFVPKTIRSQEFTIEKDTLTFGTITEGELNWMWGQVDNLAISSFAPTATYGAGESESVTATLTYYKADNDGDPTGDPIDIGGIGGFGELDAGKYVIVATVDGGEDDNYIGGSENYSFEVEKADPDSENVKYTYEITINNQADWTYLDGADHAITVTVNVGGHTLESGNYTVYYYTRGSTGSTWGDGTALTAQADGSYALPDNANAGEYYIGVAVKETANHADDTLGYQEQNAFTINKKEITIREPERQYERTGSGLRPSELFDGDGDLILLNADGSSTPDLTDAATVTGYAIATDSPTFSETMPTDFGSYYMRLTLKDADNYAWEKLDSQITGGEDQVEGAHYDVYYQITGTIYTITVTASNWTYGGDITVPTFEATGSNSVDLAAALENGATVTYSFYRLANENDNVGTLVEGATVTRTSADESYALGAMPAEVANNPGRYRVLVVVSQTSDNNYASAEDDDSFIVSPYTLQANDIVWQGVTGHTYDGEEVTFAGDEPDIAATYKNWTYNESTGEYEDATSTSYLVIKLQGGGSILNAGNYTLKAALPKGESNVTLSDGGLAAMSETVEVEKLALSVTATLKEGVVTYYGDAAPTAFAHYDVTLAGALDDTEEAALELLLRFAAQNYTVGTGVVCSIVGTYTVHVTFDADADTSGLLGNYEIAYVDAESEGVVAKPTFKVEKRTITVTIEDKTSVYGDNIVGLAYSIDGQTFDGASDIFTLTTTATNSSNAGSYSISGAANGSRAGNYNVTFKGETSGSAGTYTITPRTLTVTASVNETIEYGDAAPTAASAYTVTITNALEKDEALLKSLLAFDPQYSVGDNAGTTYDVNVSFTKHAILKNYGITADSTVATAELNVVARKITVTINDITTDYGTAAAFTVGLARDNGTGGDVIFFNDLADGAGVDQYKNVFTLALKGADWSENLDAGVYSIVGSTENCSRAGNYAVTFAGSVENTKGSYTVSPEAIAVDFALNAHNGRSDLVFDGSAWTYTATGTGVNGEGTISFPVTYTARDGSALTDGSAVNAGEYTVGVVETSGLCLSTDGNYQATTGTQSQGFTIAKRAVTVSWTENSGFVYNGSNQSGSIKATYLPWVEGAQSTTAAELAIDKVDFTDWKDGGYTFTAGLASDLERQNYTLNGAGDDGKVTQHYDMQKLAITVQIVKQSSEYGESLVVFSNLAVTTHYTISSGTLHDNAGEVFSLATTATNRSNVGLYNINGTQGGDRAHNYTVTFENGSNAYEITQRKVNVTLSEYEFSYKNAAYNAFTAVLGTHYTVNRLVEGDNLNITLTPGADDKNAGSYAYAYYTWSNTNYDVTFTNAAANVFVIVPAEITISIADKESTYGDQLAALECTLTDGNLYNNSKDSVVELGIYAQNDLESPVSVPDDGHLAAGEYIISVVGSKGVSPYTSGNFEITFENATYTVKTAGISISFAVDTTGHLSESLESGVPVFDGKAWAYNAYGLNSDGTLNTDITFTVTYYEGTEIAGASPLDGAPTNAGTYTVVVEADTSNNGNYAPTGTVQTTFSILKRNVTLTWADDNFTYDGTDQFEDITATYLPWLNGEESSEAVSLAIGEQEFIKADSYIFTATLEDSNYTLIADTGYSVSDEGTTASKDYRMKQAEITVTVKAQRSYYGEDLADLTASGVYTISGDTYDAAGDIFTLTAMNTNGSALKKGDAAGDYYIRGKVINSNYAVTWGSYNQTTGEVADYTIARRPVQIVLTNFNMIYGTDLSESDYRDELIALSGLTFTAGNEGLTGNVFVETGDDAESAARSAVVFAFPSGYGEDSAAGTAWDVTASLTNQTAGVLSNYTFVTDTSTMTIIPRPITVTLPSIGDYTYGTQALEDALTGWISTAQGSVELIDDWSDYGDAIVDGDRAADIYTLVVDGVSDFGASTPVGDYTLVGQKQTSAAANNYTVTFVNDGEQFAIAAATFEVVSPATEVEVTYTGENYYFREEDWKDGAETTYLFNHGLNVTTAGFLDSLKDGIEYTWTFTVEGNGTVTYLTAANTYTVNYTVEADNFTKVTGEFTVEITTSENHWVLEEDTAESGYEFSTTWYYGEAIDGGVGAENEYEINQEAPNFTAYMGTMVVEYYETRSGANGSYTYSNKIDDGASFFGKTTAAGTYYVKVYVNETTDWAGIEAHGVITVGKRTVDINWASGNISLENSTTTPSGTVLEPGKNVTIGFDSALMKLNRDSIPSGVTVSENPNAEGEIEVTVKADAATQLTLYFELKDANNYRWPTTSTTVSDDGKIKQISFSVNATANTVVFVGASGNLEQDTGISIVYGEELTWTFATTGGAAVGTDDLLIKVDSILASGIGANIANVQFVKTTEGDTTPGDQLFNLSSLNGADAGVYWMRVQVFPTGESGYGYGIGYLKVTITQREVGQSEIDNISFGAGADGEVHFTYNGEEQLPTATNVPEYLEVTFGVADGGAINAGDHTVTATISIADENYKFADGVTTEKTITLVIDPMQVEVSWEAESFTYNGEDQLASVTAYFVDVDGNVVRLKVSVYSFDGGSTTQFLTAGDYTMQAAFVEWTEEGTGGTEIKNYTFAEVNGGETCEFIMNKLPVVITRLDQDVVYTGVKAEINGDAYYVDMFTHDAAAEIGRYEDLLGSLEIVVGEEAVDVGEYTLSLSGYEGLTNYDVTVQGGATLTITPKQLSFDWKSFANGVYGEENGISLEGTEFEDFVNNETYAAIESFVRITYSGTSWSGQKYENSTTVPEEAGNYIVTVQLAPNVEGAACNYSMQAQSRVYVIEKATVKVPTIDSATYNGNTQMATGITGDGFTVITNEGGTDAGSYPVVLALNDSDNYQWVVVDEDGDPVMKIDSETYTAQFVIEKAEGYEFGVSIDGWTYGEPASRPELSYITPESLPEGGSIVYLYTGKTNGGDTYESEYAPTEAGTYTLTVKLRGMTNYKDATSEEVSFTIARATAVIDTSSMPKEYTYNGNEHTIEGATLNHDKTTLQYSISSVTNAGEHTVTITAAQTNNYKYAETTVTVVVNKATFEVTVNISGWTYGESSKAPGYTEHPEGLTATVEYAAFGSEEFSKDVPTNAGSYTVKVTYAEGMNYAAAVGTATFTIAKADAVIDTDGMQTEYTYTGAEQTITGAVLTFGDATLVYYNNTFTDVPVGGTLVVTIYAPETENFNSATKTVEITVYKAEMTIGVNIEDWANWTYGDVVDEPIITYSTGELPAGGYPEYLYTGKMNGDRDYSSSTAPTEAGTYTLKVTLKGMTNYEDATSEEVTFTIARATAVIDTSSMPKEYTYNGNEQTIGGATLNHTETTLVYEDNTFTDVPEGGKLLVTIKAAQTNNYEAAEEKVTIIVHKATLELSVGIDDWTYGKKASEPSVSGNAGGGELTYRYTGTTNGERDYSSSDAPTEAGKYTLTVTAAETQNYLGGEAEATFTIARAEYTPEINFLLRVDGKYGWTYGETPETNADIWAFADETFAPKWTAYYTANGLTGRQIPTEAGQYTLTVEFDETDNYLAGESNVQFEIFKAVLSPEVSIEGWTYGESPNEPEIKYTGELRPDDAVISYLYKGTSNGGETYESSDAPKAAGEYTVTVKLSGMQNFKEIEKTVPFTIARADAVIDTSGVQTSYTYNGRYQSVGGGATLNHNETQLVYSPDTVRDAGSFQMTIIAAQTNNYEAAEAKVTITVYRASPGLRVSIEDWTYGEEASVPVVTGYVSGGRLSYSYRGTTNGGVRYSGTAAPTEAGEYTLTVTVSATGNYYGDTASQEFVIHRAATVIDTDEVVTEYTFNGEMQSLSSGAALNHDETVPEYLRNTFFDAGTYKVTIFAAETNNYAYAEAEVTVTVKKAAPAFEVVLEDWTYGEAPNEPVLNLTTGLRPDDGEIAYLYTGTTNGGETYESALAPTEAGEYTVTVTLSGMQNFEDSTKWAAFTVGRAEAVIETDEVVTEYTYNGSEQTLLGEAALNHDETVLVYENTSFTDAGTYQVTISAEETRNYQAAEVTLDVVVHKAALGLEVSISGWMYGEEANVPVITGNAGGGALTYRYTGMTNGGETYESELAPAEAGEYTLTVTAAETENYLGGSASVEFAVERAPIAASVTIEDRYFGDEPNGYVLTPSFLTDEVVRVLYEDEEGRFSEQPPVYAGNYTITVYYGETANYLAGEATASFEVIERPLQMSVTLEDWTYGDEANAPVVTGAYGLALIYRYTGTANDGTVWDSDTAPSKAGSYTLTVTTADSENYDNASCSVEFNVLRRLIAAPAWNEEGLRAFTEEHNGKTNTLLIVGYDGALMTVGTDGVRFELTPGGGAAVSADMHGVYTIVFTLTDAANYGWAGLEEGESINGPVTLIWTLTEHVISILWLIILLAVLVLIALIILIVLLAKSKKTGAGGATDGGAAETAPSSEENGAGSGEALTAEDAPAESGGSPNGSDDGQGGEVRLRSLASIGMLLVIVPLGEVIAAIVLGAVFIGLVIADIVYGVRLRKRTKAAAAMAGLAKELEEAEAAMAAVTAEPLPEEVAEGGEIETEPEGYAEEIAPEEPLDGETVVSNEGGMEWQSEPEEYAEGDVSEAQPEEYAENGEFEAEPEEVPAEAYGDAEAEELAPEAQPEEYAEEVAPEEVAEGYVSEERPEEYAENGEFEAEPEEVPAEAYGDAEAEELAPEAQPEEYAEEVAPEETAEGYVSEEPLDGGDGESAVSEEGRSPE